MYDDITARAVRAYVRSDGAESPRDPYGWPYGLDLPSNNSGPASAHGRDYVVLRGGRGSGPLAVYRVRNSGKLRRLRQWPRELEEW